MAVIPIRFQRQCLAQRLLSVIETIASQVRQREVAVSKWIGRLNRDRLADQSDGSCTVSSLVANHASQMQCIEVVGIDVKDATVDCVGVVETPGLMMDDCVLNRLNGRSGGRDPRHGSNRLLHASKCSRQSPEQSFHESNFGEGFLDCALPDASRVASSLVARSTKSSL